MNSAQQKRRSYEKRRAKYLRQSGKMSLLYKSCPTCHATVAVGERCPQCAILRAQRSEATRPSAQARGYGRAWREFRQNWLHAMDIEGERKRRQVMLQRQRCADPYHVHGKVIVPAQHVDHIIPVEQAPDKRWDSENLQGLCRQCHSRKTASEDGAYGNSTERRNA